MRVLKMQKENLMVFLESIRGFGELWGVVDKGNRFVFDKLDDLSDYDFKPRKPMIPPKLFMHPPKFSMFRFNEKGYEAELEEITNRVIFGVLPCDIHGLLILDRLFGAEPPDPYYMKRREKTIILGLSCVPGDTCLAKATNTHVVEEGFDLFFSDLDDYYLVWVGSSKGDDLVRVQPDLFEEKLEYKDLEKFIEWKKDRDSCYPVDFDFTAMPDIMELSYNSPVWEKIGEKCLACGSCTMVCPTCNCYDVVDRLALGKFEGIRERHWDSCMYKEYSMVAGGHNFREARSQRLKLWYTHKLQGFIGQFGKPSCVGCGRCVETCPVDINVVTVAKALKGEPVEAFWNR